VQSSNSQNQPPVVSITSPANNASFNTPANITVNANAADSDGTIARVEFYQGTVRLGEDITAPYSFDWNSVAAGNYSLTARAFDNTGASTISSPINVTVIQPNALPVVSLTAPANNASFNAPASITIIANAADSDGTIAKVEFYQGAVKLGEDTAAPFSFTWNNVSAGSYSLTARATDNAGATTTSGAINILVNAAQANRPPVATIITPTSGAAFAPGSVVNYQAAADDPDETLPASAYKWNIILHHDDHVHPQLESTGPSGSFTVEAHANGTYFYELVLTVTDSGGLSDTKRLNLAPVTQGNGQLPVPWSTADVGATQPGSATFASDVFTVRGGGPDIWGDLDGFHFTHQQVAGDFTFTARVASLENTDYWAKAGLMIRENLSAGSRNVGNFVNPEAGTYFQFRNATGSFTDEIFTSRLRPAVWMRLVRRGDIIEAWQSVDGANWERVTSQTTILPETVYIGLAVTSHSNSVLATATFDRVSVIR
jgi:regulation of enolase protein 1 (concanavalin A-like superfamily)